MFCLTSKLFWKRTNNISGVPRVRDGWQPYRIPDTMESKNGQKLAEGGFMWSSRMPGVPAFYTLRRYSAYCIF